MTPPEPIWFHRCHQGMTTRRNFLTLVGAGAALAAAGCAAPARQTRPTGQAANPDVLLLDTTAGLGALRDGHLTAYGPAVPTPDNATVYAAATAGPDTDLRTIAAVSGAITATTRLRGIWVPHVSGSTGGTVALTPPAPATADPYAPGGRGQTSILVVGTQAEPVRLDLAGNYAPDAFASDNTGLFVLDWQPATAPDHYRVREIDFMTRTPNQLFTRDKRLIPPDQEEKMRGQRRNAVFGPVAEVLYTLYTNQPGRTGDTDGWDTAFIHTLHLAQHWAYCVDLDAPFGIDPNASHAIAIAPDGSALYVADVKSGRLAMVDTDALSVRRTVAIPASPSPAYAVATTDALFVGAGSRVHAIDPAALTVRASWDVSGPIGGLAAGGHGDRLYIGLPGAVAWHDTASGRRLGTRSVSGVTGIRAAI
jgi:hypothetical protein